MSKYLYKTNSDKAVALLFELASKYLVWLITGGVILAWWFLPGFTGVLAQVVMFWAPIVVLVCGLIIAITRTRFRAKRDEEQEIYQYEIIIKKSTFYLIDLIVYTGTMLILIIPYAANEKGVDPIDLIQALIFFILCGAIRQIIYKKTCQY
jgi:hypothetical protein